MTTLILLQIIALVLLNAGIVALFEIMNTKKKRLRDSSSWRRRASPYRRSFTSWTASGTSHMAQAVKIKTTQSGDVTWTGFTCFNILGFAAVNIGVHLAGR